MAKSRPLTPENQKLLEEGIDYVSNQVGDGESVNDAFRTYCKQAYLNPQLSNLLGTLLNNGIAESMREKEGGLAEILGTTELIDLPQAQDDLFGSGFNVPKTASCEISDVYLTPPVKKEAGCCTRSTRSGQYAKSTVKDHRFGNVTNLPSSKISEQHTDNSASAAYQKYQVKKSAEAKLKHLTTERCELESALKMAVTAFDAFMKRAEYDPSELKVGFQKLFGEDGKQFLDNYPVFLTKRASGTPDFMKEFNIADAPYKYADRILKIAANLADCDADIDNLRVSTEKELCRLNGEYYIEKDAADIKGAWGTLSNSLFPEDKKKSSDG